MTHQYGDMLEHLPMFKNIELAHFSGYSSLSELVNHIKTIDYCDLKYRSRSNSVFQYDPDAWSGTKTLEQAFKLAQDGWKEGRQFAEQAMEKLTVDHAGELTRSHGVAGSSVNIGRMLAGDPCHMRRKNPQFRNKIITVFNNVSSSSFVKSETINLRAALIAAIIDRLENSGYRCEVITMMHSMTHSDRVIQLCKIKEANEVLNLSNIMFGCGHAAMLRRLFLASVFALPNIGDNFTQSYGRPVGTHLYKEFKENSVTISPIQNNVEGTFEEKIQKIYENCVQNKEIIKW